MKVKWIHISIHFHHGRIIKLNVGRFDAKVRLCIKFETFRVKEIRSI